MMGSDIYQCKSQQVSMFYRYMAEGSAGQPLVVFLHGAAGNGYDNKLNIRDSGLGNLSYYVGNNTSATLVVPQCPYGVMWPDDRMTETLNEFVSYCVKRFAADPDRVYVTGYSMGGIGTWKLVQKHPGAFAAAVPICGGPLSDWEYDDPVVTEDLAGLSVWAFNSVNDSVVQNIYSKNVMSKLWTGESTKAHLTEGFEGHTDNWVYSDKNVMNWMFQQKR